MQGSQIHRPRVTAQLALAAAIVLIVSAPAAARTWTDLQGKTIEATFVRIHEENVVLRRGVKVANVPYVKLSSEDRRYLAGLLDERGEGDQLPPIGQKRNWRDIDGNTISARFVRVKDGHVVLWNSGEVRAVPFEQFSPKDRKHVRDGLTRLAMADALPPPAADEQALEEPPVAAPPATQARQPASRNQPPRSAPTRSPSRQRPAQPTTSPPRRPATRIASEMRCVICGKQAPAGAKTGDSCRYCTAENKRRQQLAHQRLREAQARIDAFEVDTGVAGSTNPSAQRSSGHWAYTAGSIFGVMVLCSLILFGAAKLLRLLVS